MSVADLLNSMRRDTAAGEPLNWSALRAQIIDEHKRVSTTQDRVALLALHKAVMDAVDRQIAERDRVAFRSARSQDYSLLLVSEAMIGVTDGNVDPAKMLAITTREVAAGRLDRNDELHRIALGGLAQFEPKKRGGFLSKVRSIFAR